MANTIDRSNPDDLLKSIERDEIQKQRGELHVFLGMCPGVGKTYTMLRVAREVKEKGHDIVVGVIETHGRVETARMAEGFEVIPLQKIEYKNSILQELDLDAVLKRKPKIVLIDELAHSNVPGSRHAKRYQDVEEIISRGISVYTTVNIQHISSRSDLVSQIVGTQIRETVPDSFLEKANQVELIDLSPEDLLVRLQDGKVYIGDRAERASKNFFKIENLIALREISLRFTAEKVDDQLRSHMAIKQIKGPWNTNERLMVAVSYSPFSAKVIRATRRMAYNLEAPWVAVYVDTGKPLHPEDQVQLSANLSLAEELGAEVIHTRDVNIFDAIQRVAAEKNVTQIVMGRPDRRWILDLFSGGTLLDRLVSESSTIDVHIIREAATTSSLWSRAHIPAVSAGLVQYWSTLWFIGIVAAMSYAALPWIGYRSIGFIFLLAVLAVGTAATFGPVLFAAVLSSLIWDYFFMPPQFTFIIQQTEDALMCIAYLVVAIASGLLTHRIRRQESDLISRAHRAGVLYEFGRLLAEAQGIKDIASRTTSVISNLFEVESFIFLKDKDGQLSSVPINSAHAPISPKDIAVATWSFQNGREAGYGTDTLAQSRCICIPLRGRSGIIGIFMASIQGQANLALYEKVLLQSVTTQSAIALERALLEGKANEVQLLEKSEQLHQALLSSVSHELRTPLTSIIGAATALKDHNISANELDREQLIDNIVSSSERLNRVVENILDMTRINSGTLHLKLEVIDWNDFIRTVVDHTNHLARSANIQLKLDEQDIYIKGDPKLLEHVLQNLFSNAAVYNRPENPIVVTTWKDSSSGFVKVADSGLGIPSEALERVFDRFYRVPGSPPGGTGLGLSIVKSLVELHSGKVEARNSEKQGAEFVVQLPLTPVPVQFSR